MIKQHRQNGACGYDHSHLVVKGTVDGEVPTCHGTETSYLDVGYVIAREDPPQPVRRSSTTATGGALAKGKNTNRLFFPLNVPRMTVGAFFVLGNGLGGNVGLTVRKLLSY